MPNSHLANKPILINRSPLLPRRQPRRLRPHLLDILKHHIEMSIESLDTAEHLAVVAQRDEDLGMVAHGGLEDREWTGGEFVFFELGDFVLGQFGARFCEELGDFGVGHGGGLRRCGSVCVVFGVLLVVRS